MPYRFSETGRWSAAATVSVHSELSAGASLHLLFTGHAKAQSPGPHSCDEAPSGLGRAQPAPGPPLVSTEPSSCGADVGKTTRKGLRGSYLSHVTIIAATITVVMNPATRHVLSSNMPHPVCIPGMMASWQHRAKSSSYSPPSAGYTLSQTRHWPHSLKPTRVTSCTDTRTAVWRKSVIHSLQGTHLHPEPSDLPGPWSQHRASLRVSSLQATAGQQGTPGSRACMPTFPLDSPTYRGRAPRY